jgi:hypothetical protein
MPDAKCQAIDALPCIMAGNDDLVVRVPGSTYQPLLIKPQEGSKCSVSPGAMNETEARFVRDLIAWLCPDGNYPDLEQPLQWHGKEIWLRRNLDRHDDSFRLDFEGSDWFYPDFLIWIVDRKQRIQTLGFVDPKGMREGVEGGWADYKVLCTLYQPHVIEQRLAEAGQVLILDGEPWAYRLRGILLATSDAASGWRSKFTIDRADGTQGEPEPDELRLGRILYQPPSYQPTTPDKSYIQDVLSCLETDTSLDGIMRQCVKLQPNTDSQTDQVDPWLRNLFGKYRGKPHGDFLAHVIRSRIAKP